MLTPVFIAILLMTNGINRAFPIDDENGTDFPIHELFGVPATTPGLNVYQCHPPSLYNGYSSSKEERCYCECAADCMMYGTCCVDFLWDKKQPLPLKECFVKFLKERNKYNNEKKLTCQPMIPMQSTKNKHIATSYHMIASCPSNATNLTIVEKCTKLTVSTLYSMIPVLGSDGHAYRNNYCAQCNGENNFNQHIDIEVKCVDAENIKGKTNIDLVDIGNIEECVFEPSNKFIRKMKKCTKQEEEQCSPENDNYKLCHAYQGVFRLQISKTTIASNVSAMTRPTETLTSLTNFVLVALKHTVRKMNAFYHLKVKNIQNTLTLSQYPCNQRSRT